MPATTTTPELVKMSTLARRSGVPAATIKHYLREGLLPPADVRTGRNMALYDARLVGRVKAIKELQRTKFLPLKVIKAILEGIGPDHDGEIGEAIQRALDEMSPMEARTRKQLVEAGVSELDLDFLRNLGVLSPEGPHGPLTGPTEPENEVYVGDDLRLLRILGESRKAGITAEMLPPGILAPYAKAIRELVRTELVMFREGVIPHAGDDLKSLAAVATRLSEQLVVILRRKLLLPTLRQLVAEKSASQDDAPDEAAPVEAETRAPADVRGSSSRALSRRRKPAPRTRTKSNRDKRRH